MHFNNIPFLIQTLVAGVFRFLGNFISTLDPLASLINDRNKPSGIYLELSLLGSFQLWGGIRTVNFTFFCLLGIVHKKKENSTIVMSYQTCMIYVLLWNTKEKVLKVKEDKNCQAPKGQKKSTIKHHKINLTLSGYCTIINIF